MAKSTKRVNSKVRASAIEKTTKNVFFDDLKISLSNSCLDFYMALASEVTPFVYLGWDNNISDMLSLSNNISSRIRNLFAILLIPNAVYHRILIKLFSKIYAYRAGNSVLVTWLGVIGYLINVFAIPTVILYLLNQLTIVTAVIGFITSLIFFAAVNASLFNDIIKSSGYATAQIDKQIDFVIANEKNLKRQRIKVEALFALQRFFSKIGHKVSFAFIYASMSAAFLTEKLNETTRDASKKRFEALELETDQILSLLAESSVLSGNSNA